MIVLGRIGAPCGVKGWLRFKAYGDDPQTWAQMPQWWLGREDEDVAAWRTCKPQQLRRQGGDWLVKLEQVDDRESAAALAGCHFGAPRPQLPPTASDEYYWDDLIGLQVVNESGQTLGRVSAMMEAGAHAVAAIEADATTAPGANDATNAAGDKPQQRLLPFVDAVVKEVDLAAGVMRVAWEAHW